MGMRQVVLQLTEEEHDVLARFLARGIKTGRGARNDATSRTVREVAEGLGVSEDTATRRLNLARALEPYPETAAKVDRGEVKVKDALVAAVEEAQV